MARYILILTLFLTSSFSFPAFAQPLPNSGQTTWPSFRGNGQSVTSASNLPTKWSDTKNILWSTDLPGYGQSSPVVWDDRVFVTTMQGERKETPTVLCVGLHDGRVIWKKEFESTQEVEASNYVTRSAPTPAVDENSCFAFFESGELLATDHQGTVRWQRSLVDEYGEFQGNHGIGSSIAINGQSVFVLVAHEGSSYLLAANKTDGNNVWKTDLDEQVAWSSPIVVGNVVLLSMPGAVAAFDTTSGEQLWGLDEVKGNTVASLTVHQDVGFVGSSEKTQNFAFRFDPSGKQRSVEVAWQNDKVTSSFGSPLYHDGQVYYVNKAGVAFAVDAETGETTWEQRVSGSCWASPLSAGDRLYFFAKDGATDVFETASPPNAIGTNSLSVEDRVYGVAAVDEHLLIRTGTRLTCVSELNSDEPQAVQDDQQATNLVIEDCPVAVTSFGAAVCDGYLYVYGGNHGEIHAYSQEGQNNRFHRIKLESDSTWEFLGEVPRRQGMAMVAHRGKLYRLGGFEAKNKGGEDEKLVSTDDFERFDPATRTWTKLASLPEPRSSFDAVVAGDTLYVIGGWQLDGDRDDSKWHGTAWQIDLSQSDPAWKPMPAPPHERRANSVAELDGKIYLIGGMGDDATPTRSVYSFDVDRQKWSAAPKLSGDTMDGFGSSSFNVGGRLIVSTFSGQVLQLSADGSKWEKIGTLDPGRFFHRLVAMDERRFIIVGGTSPESEKQSHVLILDRTLIR